MREELVPLCQCCDCYNSGETGIAAESTVSTRNGEAQIIEEDVSMRAYNFPFAIKRSWSNRNNTAGIFGLGWYVEDIPSLDATHMVITSGVGETLYFEEISANRYGAKYFAFDILTYDSGSNEYLWTAPQGMRNRFDGDGKWLGGTSLKGHEMEVAYTGTKIDSVTVAFEAGSSSA